MPNSENAIHHVSDTALWVAHYRALESERPNALFRDPHAKRLAGERGRKIAESMGSTSRYTQWTLVIRTVLIDRYVEKAIADGVDLVLNLGAGLDTRPYRMTLPASLQWIEVDHPGIIDHKETILAAEKPRCRLERVRLDLSDGPARRAFLSGVAKRAKRVLVLTEGVLPYLTEAQVSELAEDLGGLEEFTYWVAEYFAKEVYRYIDTSLRTKQMANAPFQFFPGDWFGFFAGRGWFARETRFLGEETLKLNRKIPMPWWTFVFRVFASKERFERVQRMTGYVLFGKGKQPADP